MRADKRNFFITFFVIMFIVLIVQLIGIMGMIVGGFSFDRSMVEVAGAIFIFFHLPVFLFVKNGFVLSEFALYGFIVFDFILYSFAFTLLFFLIKGKRKRNSISRS